MTKATLTTGDLLIHTRGAGGQKRSSERPLQVLVVADFSGHSDRDPLAQRPAKSVDRDTLDDVFARMKVQLSLPFANDPVRFAEIDDLHPDVLIDKIPLFARLRQLQRQLRMPERFASAAAEIDSWASVPARDAPQTNHAGESAPTPERGHLLEDMLEARQSSQSTDAALGGNIDALIRDIVAPYVEPKANPQVELYEAAVHEAACEALRKIMHTGPFRRLEAHWRGLDFLLRRSDSQRPLKIKLLDVREDELVDDLVSAETLADSALAKAIANTQQHDGPSLILVDYQLRDRVDDVKIASAIAAIGAEYNALALLGGSERLAGCGDIATEEDVDDWHYPVDTSVQGAWQNLRQEDMTRHLGVVAPRFLLRQPYGKRSAPIETLNFEELGEGHRHRYYCWGNGVWLVALLLINRDKSATVGDLPLHVYRYNDEAEAKPCAEVYLRDRAADRLAEVGFTSLRSVRNHAAVSVPVMRSLHVSGSDLPSVLTC